MSTLFNSTRGAFRNIGRLSGAWRGAAQGKVLRCLHTLFASIRVWLIRVDSFDRFGTSHCSVIDSNDKSTSPKRYTTRHNKSLFMLICTDITSSLIFPHLANRGRFFSTASQATARRAGLTLGSVATGTALLYGGYQLTRGEGDNWTLFPVLSAAGAGGSQPSVRGCDKCIETICFLVVVFI